eukprot:9261061-Alexandrium_andersonii.AAC.1
MLEVVCQDAPGHVHPSRDGRLGLPPQPALRHGPPGSLRVLLKGALEVGVLLLGLAVLGVHLQEVDEV